MKTKIVSIALALAFVLAACGSAKSTANFPAGKFIKSGAQDNYYVFNTDGTWELYDGGFQVASGTFEVNGDVYTDTTKSDCGPEMSFTYTFDGTNLTFNYVGKPEDDPCVNRTWDMNNVTYILSK